MVKKKQNIINMFIGSLTKNGNRFRAEKIFLSVMQQLKFKLQINPLFVLEECIKSVRPSLRLKPKKVAGITYQLPAVLRLRRSNVIAIKWILSSTKGRTDKGIVRKLVNELSSVYVGKGPVYRKRKLVHRTALNNRAFLKYARKR